MVFTHLVREVNGQLHQHSFVLPEKGPFSLPATVEIKAKGNGTAKLTASVFSEFTVTTSTLIYTPQINGDLDYFTMVPTRSDEDHFGPTCMSRESGYYYQHVVFERSNSSGKPCALTIPGLYYGFVFTKSSCS